MKSRTSHIAIRCATFRHDTTLEFNYDYKLKINDKMKTLKNICFVVLLSFIFIACEKEEPSQEHSLIELQLVEFVKTNNITKCTIREYRNGEFWEPVQESSFKFSNGFIIVNHYYWQTEISYNLQNLNSYRKVNGNVLWIEFL